MIHVEDAFPGKKCGCKCAECGKPLIASNNEPRKVAKYFRHAIGAECPGGLETAIHRAAKEALLRKMSVRLPGKSQTVSFQSSDGKKFSKTVSLPSRSLSATSAHEEMWQANMRPDVVFFVDEIPLYIEIRVTHAVDEDKRAKIREKGTEAVEINLSDISPDEILNMSIFENRVCQEIENRLWLSWPAFDDLLEAALREMRDLRDSYEAAYQRSEERRRLLEQQAADRRKKEEEEQRDALLEKIAEESHRRELMRRRYSLELSRMYDFQSEDHVEKWDRYLQGYILHTSPQRETIDSSPFLLAKVDGFWIFNARYQDWQAYILDPLFPVEPSGSNATVREIRDSVVKRFGVLDWVETINSLEHARKRYPNSDKGLALHTTEVGLVPDPYTVISRFLAHLAKLKMVSERLDWIDGDWKLSLAKAVGHYNERTEEKRRKAEREEREAKAYLDNQRQRYLNSWRIRKDYELAILASETLVYRTMGRLGLRCKRCHLVNPLKTNSCRYCGNATSFTRVALDDEYMRTSPFRVRTSAEVSRILLDPPELALAELQPIIIELTESHSA